MVLFSDLYASAEPQLLGSKTIKPLPLKTSLIQRPFALLLVRSILHLVILSGVNSSWKKTS